MRRRTTTTAAFAAAAALAVGGCGSSDDPTPNPAPKPQPAPLKQAATATKDAGSARVSLRGKVIVAGKPMAVTGRGVVDLRRTTSSLRVGADLPAVGHRDVDAVLKGSMLYVKAGGLTSLLSGGKDWVKVDLAKAAKQGPGDPGGLQGLAAGADLSQLLTWLTVAGNPVTVGKEQVGGVETTHYRARVDARKLAATGDAQVQRTVRQLGLDVVPIETWIDDQGLVRRLRVTVPGRLDVTADLSDYGAKLPVTAPADDQALDVTGLAATGLRLLG